MSAQIHAVDRVAALVGQVEMALAIGGHIGEGLGGAAGCGAWERQSSEGFTRRLVEGAQGIQVGDVEDVIDDHHALGGMERDVSAAALNELEGGDPAVVAQLGNESIVIPGVGFPVDVGNVIGPRRRVGQKTMRRLQSAHLKSPGPGVMEQDSNGQSERQTETAAAQWPCESVVADGPWKS
jgi:hypothetical protein